MQDHADKTNDSRSISQIPGPKDLCQDLTSASSSKAGKNIVSKGDSPEEGTSRAKTISTSSSGKAPSTPVLVNSGLPKMHLPMSPHSFLKGHSKTKSKPQLSSSSPSPASFSISSILSTLQAEHSTQADIDAIAEIYSKSHLSLANEYGSHMTPIGPGFDLGDGNETEDEDGRRTPALALDTIGAVQHTRGLETVEELPTPMSEGSRKGFPVDGYISTRTSTSAPSQSTTVSADSHESPGPMLSIWQARTERGRITGRSVAHVSMDVEAHGVSSSVNDQRPDLRDGISGTGTNSRAVQQLMRTLAVHDSATG